jgi:hypothetical protein
MTDTPEYVRKLYRDMLLRLSSEERLRMGCRMFTTAVRLVRASFDDPSGTDNSGEMRARVFLRLYGHDFDPPTARRIAEHLKRTASGGRVGKSRADRPG